jgi:hypothetical protein
MFGVVVAAIGIGSACSFVNRTPSFEDRDQRLQQVANDLSIPGVGLGPMEKRDQCPVGFDNPVQYPDQLYFREVVSPMNNEEYLSYAYSAFQRMGWETRRDRASVIARFEAEGGIEVTVVAFGDLDWTDSKEVHVGYTGPGNCRLQSSYGRKP